MKKIIYLTFLFSVLISIGYTSAQNTEVLPPNQHIKGATVLKKGSQLFSSDKPAAANVYVLNYE